jgi:hypothetical protein
MVTAVAVPDRALPKMRRLGMAFTLALRVVLTTLAARGADASIHKYGGGGFSPWANSYGGSEGLYASASFIRYALAHYPLLVFDRACVVGVLR